MASSINARSTRWSVHWLNDHRNVALFIANGIGAMFYLPLALIAWTRHVRNLNRVTPDPLFVGLSLGVLLLFLIVNVAWGIVVLRGPHPRRWEYYGFVWAFGLWW
jgi:hypothetical protein